MTDSGMTVLPGMSENGFCIAPDIIDALRSAPVPWGNFRSRLQKLLDNTKAGVMYGEWNDNGRLLQPLML